MLPGKVHGAWSAPLPSPSSTSAPSFLARSGTSIVGDLSAALATVGVSFTDYLRGSEHWTRRLAEEPEIERRFDAALRGR
jgi:hypothetical protein